MQGDRSSRDVLLTLTLLDALLWRHRPLPLLCACSVHIGRLHRSRRPAGRSYKSRRALCAHGARCPASKGVRPPSPLGALAVHIGRLLYRSRHRAGRSFQSRRARCALTVCSMPFFGVRPEAAVAAVCLSCPHRTFRHCAGRSFKSRRTFDAHVARCPSLASQAAAAAVCLLRPHRTFTPLSPSCRAVVQVETCSLRSRCSMPSF